MKPNQTTLRLIGPTGSKQTWAIIVKKLPRGYWGYTDWEKRIVYLSSSMRNAKRIKSTLLHEIGHVTAGQNASEEFVQNLESNYIKGEAVLDKWLESNGE